VKKNASTETATGLLGPRAIEEEPSRQASLATQGANANLEKSITSSDGMENCASFVADAASQKSDVRKFWRCSSLFQETPQIIQQIMALHANGRSSLVSIAEQELQTK